MSFYGLVKEEADKIEINRQRRIEGKYNHIPSPFPNLNKYWPGLIPGDHILLTAGTGIGKSRYTLQNFVIWPIDWALSNNYNVQVIFFPLEDSISKIIRRFIVNRLYVNYGVELKLSELNQYVETGYLDSKIMELIRQIQESDYVKKQLGERLHLVADAYTPSQMFARVCNIMAKDGEFIIDANKIPVGFKSNNGTHWVIVGDNLNNIIPTEQGSKNEAILVWCRDYVREILCNRFQCTVVDVQQQMPTKESLSFTNAGIAMIEKLVPSIDGLGEAKATSQTAHVIFGLFSPARYNFMSCPIGYDTGKLGNFYRHLKILKSNDGEAPVELGLFYDGLTETWREMPKKNDADKMDEVYRYIETLDKKRNPTGQTQIF